MIIDLTLEKNDKGVITADRSEYRPDEAVITATKKVLHDFVVANTAKLKPYREFNDLSLIERQSQDQMRFNSYQETETGDPDEDWKSNAVRPITRNRVISIAAHVTGQIMYPAVYAQNEDEEEQRDAADVMSDLMEWSNEQSGYERTFLYGVIAALVNPAVIIHTEFGEVMRTIKEKMDDGTITKKEIVDELYSGFQDNIVSLQEFWHPDFFEPNLQKQPFIIRRRLLFFETAQEKYSGVENFNKYVEPGYQVLLNTDDGYFYKQWDPGMADNLVEEVIYWHRNRDLMLTFVNGVIMCDSENPNPRQDKKYPFTKGGFELINEGKFFYYKSLVNKLGPDEEVVQTVYRMLIDGTYLQLMPPGIVFGDEAITSSIVAPGTITTLGDTAKFQKLDIGADLNAGMQMLQKVEGSMSESSVSNPADSQNNGSQQPVTAYQLSVQEQNARTILGLFGQMIGFLVKDLGELRVSDILQFLTIGDVMNTVDDADKLKFRSFLIPDKNVDGKVKTRNIKFSLDMPDKPLSAEEHYNHSMDILKEEGGLASDRQLLKVNPDLFRKLKYKIKVDRNVVTPPSENVKKALNLEEFDRLIQLPFIDQQQVTKDLVLNSYATTKGNPDKYFKQSTGTDLGSLIGANGAPGQTQNQPNSQSGAMAQIQNQRSQETKATILKHGA